MGVWPELPIQRIFDLVLNPLLPNWQCLFKLVSAKMASNSRGSWRPNLTKSISCPVHLPMLCMVSIGLGSSYINAKVH